MVTAQKYTESRNNSSRHIVTILGVAIDSTKVSEVLSRVRSSVAQKGKLFITTPNPEIVLLASKDPKLMMALNSSDIAIPDGTGILWAGKRKKKDLTRIKGRQLVVRILEIANTKKWRVVLLGNREKSAQKAHALLEQKYPTVSFYSFEGANLNEKAEPVTKSDNELEKTTIERINKIKPEVVFVGFGAPRQEKWIYKWKSKIDASVFMVVGGTFNYLSGKTSLPPSYWPHSLEWLWRLFTKKGHWKRVWNAVIVFPVKVLLTR